MKGKRDIGDALEQVMSNGTIGGKRKSDILEVQQSSSLDTERDKRQEVQHASVPAVQSSSVSKDEGTRTLEVQQSNGSKVQNSKSSAKHEGRTQQTIYMPTELVKWLRVRAAQEEREISEIVTDLVSQYRQASQE